MNREIRSFNPEQTSEERRDKFSYVKKKIVTMTSIGIMAFSAGCTFEKWAERLSKPPEQKYIEYVEKSLTQTLPELERNKIYGKVQYLSAEFSPVIIDYLIQGDVKAREIRKESGEGNARRPLIKGFESLGVDSQTLTRLWSEENYPRGSINGNLSSVEFIDRADKKKAYGMQRAAGTEDFGDRMTFFANADQMEKAGIDNIKGNLDWHFAHELGHVDDWVNRNDLSPLERIEFLYDVASTYERPGKSRDFLDYLKNIKNPDAQKEKYYKVREWWAILNECYFTFPDLIEEDPEAFALVEKWMVRGDKDFDPAHAKQQRDAIMQEIKSH